MKNEHSCFANLILVLALAAHMLLVSVSGAATNTTAFSYQGRLNDGAQPATGLYDLRFSVFETPSGSGIVSSLITNTATPVTNGLFTVVLDFGADVFNGGDRWLQIGVRTNGSSTFVSLSPRQPLTPTPYAVFAPSAGWATLASGVSTGAITSAMLADGAVTTAKIGAGAVKPSNLDDGGTAAYNELMAAGRELRSTEPLPFSDLSLITTNGGAPPSLTFRLDGDNFGTVQGFSGREGLSEVYEYVAEVTMPSPELNPASTIGRPGLIILDRNGRRTLFGGIITGCTLASSGGNSLYTFRVQPALAHLGLTSDYRIFQDRQAPDIVSQLYTEVTSNSLVQMLSGSYSTRTFTMQFAETDLNFFSRLLEYEGIFHFFRMDQEIPPLVLGDGRSSYFEAPYDGLRYYGNFPTNPRPNEDCLRAFQRATRETIKAANLNGYDFSAPTTSLLVRRVATPGRGESYEFDAVPTETGQMEALARVRLESQRVDRNLAHGAGNAADLRPGFTFVVEDQTSANVGGEYVVVSVRHAAFRRTTNGVTSLHYGNQFEALSVLTPYRPARKTPRPVVPACTAVVTGQAGEEIWTDEHGRVKVQFHWDRYGARDQNSSGWIRVATPLAGAGWGTIFIPRMGQEVLVEFVNGDPDQPVITGSFYNGNHVPPYQLPANATRSGIKTRSSKGGTGANYNELRFEDKKGSEELYIKAEKDLNMDVNNDTMIWMGHDLDWIVDHDFTLHVRNDLPFTVDHNLPLNVGNDLALTVGNNSSLNVGSNLLMSVGNDLSLLAGHDLPIQAHNDLTVSAGRNMQIWSVRGVGLNSTNDPALALKVGGTVGANLFQGSGAGLSNLPATSLAGTIGDARLSANVALLTGSQTFTGAKTFSSAANVFSGNGSGLTAVNADQLDGQHGSFYQNASNLNAGTLSDARLSLNIPRLDGSQVFSGNNTFLGRMSVGTAVGLDTLTINGTARLNDFDLYFRTGADLNHGLGWYGSGKLFAGINLDGPVLYGCDGGGLGTACSSQNLALRWRSDGNVMIDPTSANSGALLPGLTFGSFSGEGISSRRTAGGNQFGLDFYTYGTNRLSITQSGRVGIGTATPTAALEVAGAIRASSAIRTGSETGTTQPPGYPANSEGLVIRRTRSTSQTTGYVVARTDKLTLERDGTISGLRLSYPASAGRHVVNCIGLSTNGTQVVYRNVLTNSPSAGTLTLFTDAQKIVHYDISFGDTYSSSPAHTTRVVLDRYDDGTISDHYLVGTITTTYNQ